MEFERLLYCLLKRIETSREDLRNFYNDLNEKLFQKGDRIKSENYYVMGLSCDEMKNCRLAGIVEDVDKKDEREEYLIVRVVKAHGVSHVMFVMCGERPGMAPPNEEFDRFMREIRKMDPLLQMIGIVKLTSIGGELRLIFKSDLLCGRNISSVRNNCMPSYNVVYADKVV